MIVPTPQVITQNWAISPLGRESHTITTTIKEAMFIRVNDPFLNRNIGKYKLPHIWDEVLFNNLDLHLK